MKVYYYICIVSIKVVNIGIDINMNIDINIYFKVFFIPFMQISWEERGALNYNIKIVIFSTVFGDYHSQWSDINLFV